MDATKSTSARRPFSLYYYLLIVYGLSWPFQIAGLRWATTLFQNYVWNSASMIMVGVGTWIAGRYVFQDGFAGAGWHWGKPKQHLAVIGLALTLWLLPTLFDVARGTLSWPSVFTWQQGVWVLISLFVTLIPAFGEELGWRGYLLPHLALRFSARNAVIVQGIIWWAWHLPQLAGSAVQAGLEGAALMGVSEAQSVATAVAFVVLGAAIPTILHGVVLAYIRVRSRSLAVVTVYHTAYDGVRSSLGITFGSSPASAVWTTLLLVVLGLLALWKADWKSLGREHADDNRLESRPAGS